MTHVGLLNIICSISVEQGIKMPIGVAMTTAFFGKSPPEGRLANSIRIFAVIPHPRLGMRLHRLLFINSDGKVLFRYK